MKIKEEIRQRRIYMDGSMGTMLQGLGLKPGELPERWNITHKDEIINIHKSYYDAGCNIVCTNTFGANLLSYNKNELDEIISAAVINAKTARKLSFSTKNKYIALDIGPLGKLLKPYGDFDFEKAIEVFAETVRIGVRCGVDLILIETMNDSYETKAAVLAAKENSDLPVFASNAYSEDGKLMTGASPAAMATMLDGLGVDAVGANCSLGPSQLITVVKELKEYSSVPVFAKPNAGLPVNDGGITRFGVTADEFAKEMIEMADIGAAILGGCCGTSPEYIKKMIISTENIPLIKPNPKMRTIVSSYTHCVEIGKKPVLIGERINPTGKKRFKQALTDGDMDYILNEGLAQQEKGVDILDVNVGLPGIDEASTLKDTVYELQAIIDLPLQIDTANTDAMEKALRIYNGKAMINSLSGKEESMNAVFPLVKKYGGVVVALTLDENGIPETAEGRIAVAEKILNTAKKFGISDKDIVFDTLCMSVSADPKAPNATLKALREIRFKKGINTVLGVSNISFGLPHREIVNSAFFALALENGLSSAIINPYSDDMLKIYYSFMLLHNMDSNCEKYIDFAQGLPAQIKPCEANTGTKIENSNNNDIKSALQNAIIKGLKEQSAVLCEKMLNDTEPIKIVNNEIVPALDIVGKGFEKKTVYLPQLLMSAEAAKKAFEKVKEKIVSSGRTQEKKSKFVIATVHGDIHDIGKNIVKVLLENYGFDVTDLGKDVPPEKICETVVNENAPLCGLSALMTTTVPAMEETIRQLKVKAPNCKIVVGGAVLNADYANRIGADKYAKDAMETVRYAEQVYHSL